MKKYVQCLVVTLLACLSLLPIVYAEPDTNISSDSTNATSAIRRSSEPSQNMYMNGSYTSVPHYLSNVTNITPSTSSFMSSISLRHIDSSNETTTSSATTNPTYESENVTNTMRTLEKTKTQIQTLPYNASTTEAHGRETTDLPGGKTTDPLSPNVTSPLYSTDSLYPNTTYAMNTTRYHDVSGQSNTNDTVTSTLTSQPPPLETNIAVLNVTTTMAPYSNTTIKIVTQLLVNQTVSYTQNVTQEPFQTRVPSSNHTTLSTLALSTTTRPISTQTTTNETTMTPLATSTTYTSPNQTVNTSMQYTSAPKIFTTYNPNFNVSTEVSTQYTLALNMSTTSGPNVSTEASMQYPSTLNMSTTLGPNVSTEASTQYTNALNTSTTSGLNASAEASTQYTTTLNMSTTLGPNVSTETSTQYARTDNTPSTNNFISTQLLTTSATDSMTVTFVIIVTDRYHKPIEGATVKLSSLSAETISFNLNNSSHILAVNVAPEEHSVVVIVSKPTYATNAVRWTRKDDTDMIIRLTKLLPASVTVLDNTILIETPYNGVKQGASIEFSKNAATMVTDLTNITASYLLTIDPVILPNPRSSSNQSLVGSVSLLPYAALQLTLQSGNLEVTIVEGDFVMAIPVHRELKYKEGDDIPAWYFDENTGLWVSSGMGKLMKAKSGTMFWHYTAPHLSWWMAATEVPLADATTRLLDHLNGMQFITILIIACVGIFGIGAMMVLICIKPREVKSPRTNGSARSRRDSDGGMSSTNLELQDSSRDFDQRPEMPTVTLQGITNQGIVTDELVLEVTESDAKMDVMDNYIYTTNSFLNVGGESRAETASILDAFASSEGSLTSDGSSYKVDKESISE